VGLEKEPLHQGLLIVLACRAGREVGRLEDNGVVDGESLGLGASVGGGVGFVVSVTWWAGWGARFFKGAGSDLGPCLESLQSCDLVAELPDEFQEQGDEFKEAPDERRLFSGRDVGNDKPHTFILRKHSRRAAAHPRTSEQSHES
jgi:hypothetical protein